MLVTFLFSFNILFVTYSQCDSFYQLYGNNFQVVIIIVINYYSLQVSVLETSQVPVVQYDETKLDDFIQKWLFFIQQFIIYPDTQKFECQQLVTTF